MSSKSKTVILKFLVFSRFFFFFCEIEVPNLIEFGDVHFGQEITKAFQVVNTGQVRAEFSFDIKDNGRRCQPWIQLNPLRGYIKVGEK